MGLQSSDSGGFTDSYTLVDNEISALQDRRYIPRSVLPPDAASKGMTSMIPANLRCLA